MKAEAMKAEAIKMEVVKKAMKTEVLENTIILRRVHVSTHGYHDARIRICTDIVKPLTQNGKFLDNLHFFPCSTSFNCAKNNHIISIYL